MFDLQVNGFSGVDFNGDELPVEAAERACQAMKDDGVDGILATVITASPEAMCHRLSLIVQCCEQSAAVREMIQGIHIEGPFLSPEPGYIGAHPVAHATSADLDFTKKLLEAAGGMTRLFTLAPEQDQDGKVTQFLADQGIVVAGGHCDPSRDQLLSGIDHGLSAFTHLGNGCPQLLHRHDNIVQRVLSLADQLTICFIADGAHVPLFALKNYLQVAGLEKSVIVSDAISAAGLGPGMYRLAEQEIEIGEDLVPWAKDRSHFVGSACPLSRMVANLKTIGLSDAEISALVERNPRKLIGA